MMPHYYRALLEYDCISHDAIERAEHSRELHRGLSHNVNVLAAALLSRLILAF